MDNRHGCAVSPTGCLTVANVGTDPQNSIRPYHALNEQFWMLK